MRQTHLWRCNLEDHDWVTSNPSSSIIGAQLRAVDYNGYEIKPAGRQGVVQYHLTPLEFDQLRDQWAVLNSTYDRLRQRYRTEKRSARAQLPEDWKPAKGRALSLREKKFLLMKPTATSYRQCSFNGDGNRFAARRGRSRSVFAYDNSVVKTWYYEAEAGNRITPAYGWIEKILLHEMFPGGPKDYFLRLEWVDLLAEKSLTGLPRVKENPNSPANTNSPFTIFKNCVPFNFALLPTPHDDDEATHLVIDRSLTFGRYCWGEDDL